MVRATVCSNVRRLLRRASAASLFRGSSALGSCVCRPPPPAPNDGVVRGEHRVLVCAAPPRRWPHQEQVLQAVDHGLDGKDGHPFVAEDVEAHASLEVNVGVVNLLMHPPRRSRARGRANGRGQDRGRVSSARVSTRRGVMCGGNRLRDLVQASDFGRFVRVVVLDLEREAKRPVLVHA